MDELFPIDLQCPWCGQPIEVLVDGSAGNQEYTEDCSVCCEPMVISVAFAEDGPPRVEARREGEA
jgi:hypothetical protein